MTLSAIMGAHPPPRALPLARSHKAAAADREDMIKLEWHEFRLPRTADGRAPFMRLLARKPVSALRAGAEAADAAAADFRSGDVAFDASLESGSAAAVRMRRTVDSFAPVGLVFAGARAAAAVRSRPSAWFCWRARCRYRVIGDRTDTARRPRAAGLIG
jgi:hypothetical protein